MGRDHFSKTFHSPYFQSSYYKEETPGGRFEDRVEKFLKKLIAPVTKLVPKRPSKDN